jgi:hypothetical protein
MASIHHARLVFFLSVKRKSAAYAIAGGRGPGDVEPNKTKEKATFYSTLAIQDPEAQSLEKSQSESKI